MTFHGWGAPWWLAIVMLTVVVRGLLSPLTVKQVKNMRKMQELKPDLDKLKAKYKNKPKKQQEAITKLYQERKINPAAGCLPMFIQLPVFIVLYHTIIRFEHLESFKTGGLLWFHDLTNADPYFIPAYPLHRHHDGFPGDRPAPHRLGTEEPDAFHAAGVRDLPFPLPGSTPGLLGEQQHHNLCTKLSDLHL